jgi:uncharacterized protein (TIGR04222 family)
MDVDVAPWTDAALARWRRIEAHPIGGPAAADAFVARLAREQAWSVQRAQDALVEYRRFVFLASESGHEATPSAAIDAVWHLHLLFTRDYWGRFCGETLGAPLHHDPGLGDADRARYRAQYADTLARYARRFGPPPASFWPPAARTTRAVAPHRAPAGRRGRRFGLASALFALPLRASAQGTNPLDWNGGDFLMLYLVLLPIAFVTGLLLRAWLRRQQPPARSFGGLSAMEVAMLVGGPQRVIDAGVAALHADGVLRWDATNRQLVRNDASRSLDPIHGAVLGLVLERRPAVATMTRAARAMQPLRTRLEQLGLWFEIGIARRIAALSAAPMLAVLALGLAKIGVGLSRERPVALLVLLCGVAAIVALGFWFARPRCTPTGDRERARLLATARRADAAATRTRDDLAMAVALGGTAILAGTALSGYHSARAATSGAEGGSGTGSGDSDSGSDAGSDGGSSCGGCGGGGD